MVKLVYIYRYWGVRRGTICFCLSSLTTTPFVYPNNMSDGAVPPPPERFAQLKKDISASYPDFEAKATKSWGEIIAALGETVASIEGKGSDVSTIRFPPSSLYIEG